MIEYKSYPTLHDHEPSPDDYFQRVIEALRCLPDGEMVCWHDETYENGIYRSGIDVWAPVVCDHAGLGWAWTIHDPSDTDHGGDALSIRVPRDTTNEDNEPAWHPETVSAALEEWGAMHAQRPDLRFAADPSLLTPPAVSLEEAAKEAAINPKIYLLADLEADEYQDERVMRVVRQLPENLVVAWHDDVAYRHSMYHVDIDIWAPAICEPAGLNQAWKVNDEPQDCACPEGPGLDLVIPRDETIDGQPAWHPETISQVLQAWVADYAQRPDLQFVTDFGLATPMARRIREVRRSGM